MARSGSADGRADARGRGLDAEVRRAEGLQSDGLAFTFEPGPHRAVPERPSTRRRITLPTPSGVPDERPPASSTDKDTVPIVLDDSLEPRALDAPTSRDRCLLTLLSGEHVGAFFSVGEDGLVVGRGDGVDARIDDPHVSRRHARFSIALGVPHVTDLGGVTGTFVAGQRIAGPQALSHGQHVRLGRDVVLRVGLYDAVEEKALLELFESSFEDLLTGARNRRFFEAQLDRERAYARRHAAALSVVLFDIDHFKHVNDVFGHPVGDGVLHVVAAAVQRVLRPEDVLARYGGDEFALLLRDTTAREGQILGERIRRTIERLPFRPRGGELRLTVSVGVATWLPGASSDGHTLVTLADAGMYEAKARGRNCVVSLGMC